LICILLPTPLLLAIGGSSLRNRIGGVGFIVESRIAGGADNPSGIALTVAGLIALVVGTILFNRYERLKVPEVDHETDVEKWFVGRHRSEKTVPQATVVGSFT
jgi:hypothetical protein